MTFSICCRTSILRTKASPIGSGSTSSLPQRSRNFSTCSQLSQAPKPTSTLPSSQALAGTIPPKSIQEQVLKYPQHPLLAFFNSVPLNSTLPESERLPESNSNSKTSKDQSFDGDLQIPSSFSVHDTSKVVLHSSRSWLAPELRLKSSHELHVLWYVLLMERNRLATSWDEIARVNARNLAKRSGENISKRNHRVKKSMARIKLVLNERRLALLQAQKEVRSASSSTASSPEEEEDLWEDVNEEMVAEFEQKK